MTIQIQANGQGAGGATVEYYILCPQRPDDAPGLITHLISRDVCDKRQGESYHKCPNCIRSQIWRQRNGLPPVDPATAAPGPAAGPAA